MTKRAKSSKVLSPGAKTRALAYLRVSSKEQGEEGKDGLPRQERACTKYAEEHGLEIVGVYKEDFTGTIQIGERPEGKKLLQELAAGGAGVMIVDGANRLHRPKVEGDAVEVLLLWNTLRGLGVELHVVGRGHIKSFLDLLLLLFDAKSSGDEWTALRERTWQGRKAKARRGQVVGNARRRPYGYNYTYEDCSNGSRRVVNLEVYEPEARIIEQVFRWYTRGNDDGDPMSLRGIAAELTRMKVPCRDGGAVWDASFVKAILNCTTYAGAWHYSGISVSVPAIVDRDTWTVAQKRLVNNKLIAARNSKREYVLRGRVFCTCGRKMQGSVLPRGDVYYRCRPCGEPHAGKRNQPGERLEAEAWQFVLDAMAEDFEALLSEAQELEHETQQPKLARLEIVDATIQQCEAEAAEVARAFKAARGLVKASLERDMDDVNARYEALSRERARLVAEIEQETLTDTDRDYALQFRSDFVRGLRDATPRDKMELFGVLDVEIHMLDDDHARITGRAPLEPRSIVLHSTCTSHPPLPRQSCS